ILVPRPAPLKFRQEIRFDGVSFRYTPDGACVLDHLNVVIPKGARMGLVGGTGSGKSTTLDLLMGLLEPTEGSILVDGQVLDESSIRAWQACIAHVPKHLSGGYHALGEYRVRYPAQRHRP